MKKILLQGLCLPLLFFALWGAFTHIDWVTLFNVEYHTDQTEKKLGDILWEVFQKKEITDPVMVTTIDCIVIHICETNHLDRDQLKLHVIRKDDVNAFALPDGHLVVYSGLIEKAENAEALSGVIAHEMAHIQLNHVMKKLVKELGLSVIMSLTTGKGGETVSQTARMLSSSAFDRGMEKEADIKAVDYLVNAKVNPEPFAQFLYNMDNESSEYLTWISSHPESKERAMYILEYSAPKKVAYKAVLDSVQWVKLQENVSH